MCKIQWLYSTVKKVALSQGQLSKNFVLWHETLNISVECVVKTHEFVTPVTAETTKAVTQAHQKPAR